MIKFKSITKASLRYGEISINKSEISPNDIKIIGIHLVNTNDNSSYIGRYAIFNDFIAFYIEEWNGNQKESDIEVSVTIVYLETSIS